MVDHLHGWLYSPASGGQGDTKPPPSITLLSWAVLCKTPMYTQGHFYHVGFSRGLWRLSFQELRAKCNRPPNSTMDKRNLSLHTHITQSRMNCTPLTAMTCICKHYDDIRFNTSWTLQKCSTAHYCCCSCWLWQLLHLHFLKGNNFIQDALD